MQDRNNVCTDHESHEVYIPPAILLTGSNSYGQSQHGIELSFTKYSHKNVEFGIRNNTDTTLRFSFENIVEKNGKNILNYYKISSDTLVCELLPEKKLDLKIHSSEPLNFRIDESRIIRVPF